MKLCIKAVWLNRYYLVEKKVEVKIFTDSKPLLDSVASSKQVEKKMMRLVIADMKERLIDGSVGSYRWIETKRMVADLLTKEKLDTVDMDDIIFKNVYDGIKTEKNKVVFNGLEVKMENGKKTNGEKKKEDREGEI